ncbi:MAG: peptide-binding protein [Mariprofundaceae bacterium]|nr:peptide-binding protein [Mariprofundaceae bacterium]
MRLRFISPPLLIAALLLAACSQDGGQGDRQSSANTGTDNAAQSMASAEPARGDRIVSASIGDASNLIPMIAGDASSHAIAGQMYLSLLKYDKDLNLTGQLAESWQVAKDNLSISFKLRPGLKWTDGKPLSSADCAFTLKLLLDERTQSAYKSDFVKVTRVETPDALSFTVFYNEPYSPALSSWTGLAVLPEHVFKGVDIMNTDLSRKPQATVGPYRLAEWQAQQSILLSANPDYFDGPVWISERMTRIIPDSATQFLELSAGNLDSMALTPTQYSRLFTQKEQLKRNYTRYQYLDFGYTYLGFNLKHAPFNDPRVRRAIAYAIDRQELVDGVLLGLGEAIATPYKPGTYWVNDKIKVRPFDAAKARELLAEAGWTDSNADGVMDKDGNDLSFTILTNNGNKQRADTATIIQQRLKGVGISVKVRLVEWSAFIENFINKRNFDAVILGWSLSPEPDQYSIWHSSQTGPRQFNFLTYNNPKVDDALIAATRTFDRAERKKFYDVVQEQIHADVPVVFLYAPYSLPVFHKRFHGIEAAPAGIGWNSEHWYVPAAEQKYRVKAVAP